MTFEVACKMMSDLTAPECAGVCRVPHSCCAPEYCEMSERMAQDMGAVLPSPTGHATLKYMGPAGCILEPHLRPICTVHTCAINSFGFKPGDAAWTMKYFRLRETIDKGLEQRFIKNALRRP